MNFEIKTIESFDRQIKRFAKKYPSVKKDFTNFLETLAENPTQGTPLGKDCYKIRMAISSKNKGKSGGARIITNVHVVGETIYLLSIYDKSQKSNLDEGELDALLLEIID
ncbi:type II toxin-antitoxin system RelE/ParE family toxin [Runella sp.]|jgi:mRNA-degrading endonuclease RelE of RelBE toxin-antitoxin system|uniref:type II toxin-antitoxin system RelE/ParE family toxin n=1 Tax=Runella sp. TaxID=1960881 RepID=UPI002613B52E|nr:type II toxin-antitoxin system RelE/ParE family toxin [Runella sp.]